MKEALPIMKCIVLDIELQDIPVTQDVIDRSIQRICGTYTAIDCSITEEERRLLHKQICRNYHLNFI